MKKVLVVEDRDVDFWKIEKGFGGKVVIMRAETQSEARKFLQENSDIDLIVMDFRVPGGTTPNTILLVKEIKESGYNKPIIASSLMFYNRQQLIKAGATHETEKDEVAELALSLLGL